VSGILLDSDVILEAFRGRRGITEAIRAAEQAGVATYCCAISLAEIWAGLRPGEEAATEAFFQARGDVTLDAAVGRRAGAYLSRYARSHGLELADALVAAAASTAGLRLWTLNRRHYPMADVLFHEPAGPPPAR
jgi:predicted nucleic acid-binding protein